MPNLALKQFLENHHIKYTSINHSPGFTAQEVAAAAHVSGKQLAKIVVIKMGKQLAMVVLPANEHVNFAVLKNATGINADLAKESDFKGKFPECELGAMHPFGNLFDMQVYVSSHLADKDQIIFNAGTHSELLKLAYRDFERLVHPKVIAADESRT
ncbi:MAG: aminoacyl-tRNA deacylase [Gammaproteobacteria bacterium]